MIQVRKSKERGFIDHGWLKTHHTFSFGSYFDPQHSRFRSLRVINEDFIQPGKGFDTHPHENMEIITYIVSGELEHKDSMGNGSVIRRGEVQRMTAGTGITHSELNPSSTETHLIQIWIYPERIDLDPGYEQRDFTESIKPNQLTLIASQCGKQDVLTIHQDVELYCALLESGRQIEKTVDPKRHVWVQVVNGRMILNGTDLEPGDGAAISEERLVTVAAEEDSEFLLFDLA